MADAALKCLSKRIKELEEYRADDIANIERLEESIAAARNSVRVIEAEIAELSATIAKLGGVDG